MLTESQTSRLCSAPGPATPASLQTLQWLHDPVGYVERCHARYGPVFRIDVFRWGHLVMIGEPDLAKAVFAAPDNFVSAADANEILRPVVGNESTFCLDGERHRRMRQLVAPALGQSNIRKLHPRLLELVSDCVASLISEKRIDRASHWRKLTMQAMLLLLAGVDDKEIASRFVDKIRPLTGALSSVFAFSPALQSRRFGALSPIGWFDRRLKALDGEIYKLIEATRHDSSKRETIIGRLASDVSVSPQAIRDQVVTMMIAGSDTTAAAIDWAFHWLYEESERLEGIRDRLSKQPRDPDSRAQWIMSDQGIESLYLEAMRFLPVADFNPRILRGLFAEDGLPIIAAPCALLLHRNAEQYLDSNSFNSGRFADQRPPGSCFIPFGGGVRYCPGAVLAATVIKMAIATLADQVEIGTSGHVATAVRRNVILAPKIRSLGVLRMRLDANLTSQEKAL